MAYPRQLPLTDPQPPVSSVIRVTNPDWPDDDGDHWGIIVRQPNGLWTDSAYGLAAPAGWDAIVLAMLEEPGTVFELLYEPEVTE